MIVGAHAEYQSDAGFTKDTPYLALTGKLLGVFCEYSRLSSTKKKFSLRLTSDQGSTQLILQTHKRHNSQAS